MTGSSVSFLGGGGIAPNNAVNKPGEFFVFGWSLYRDVLTLTAVPGEISPGNFMLQPWRRTGDAPSATVFPTRCPPPADALVARDGRADPHDDGLRASTNGGATGPVLTRIRLDTQFERSPRCADRTVGAASQHRPKEARHAQREELLEVPRRRPGARRRIGMRR